jgi:pimeloyl-ACP methyl ester carboxylesterase
MTWRQTVLFLAILACGFSSCKKKREEPVVEPKPVKITEYNFTYLHKSEFLQSRNVFAIRILLNTQPDFTSLLSQTKYDVEDYYIEYKTKYKGEEVVASGRLSVPKGGSRPWPIVSYHHGTSFDNASVPSQSLYEGVAVSAIASMGYVALAPDYLGFGSSLGKLTHPYYVAQYSASVVRDFIEAAKEFLMYKQVAHSEKLFLVGYSQGGNVTLAAAKDIESRPISGLVLTASAPGAGGYNLNGIFRTITSQKTYPSPNYLAYIVQSFRTAYDWSTPLSSYFREPYATRIPSLINGTTKSGAVNDGLTEELDSLFQFGFVDAVSGGSDTMFINALTNNNLHNWKPEKPMRFYHGTKDEIVPYSDTDSTYKHMLRLGATKLSLFPLPDKNHGNGVAPMLTDVLPWFNSFVETNP